MLTSDYGVGLPNKPANLDQAMTCFKYFTAFSNKHRAYPVIFLNADHVPNKWVHKHNLLVNYVLDSMCFSGYESLVCQRV